MGATIALGLVYWPGALPSSWYYTNSAGQTVMRNPCDVTQRNYLAQQGAAIAVYRMRTDRMTVLRCVGPSPAVVSLSRVILHAHLVSGSRLAGLRWWTR